MPNRALGLFSIWECRLLATKLCLKSWYSKSLAVRMFYIFLDPGMPLVLIALPLARLALRLSSRYCLNSDSIALAACLIAFSLSSLSSCNYLLSMATSASLAAHMSIRAWYLVRASLTRDSDSRMLCYLVISYCFSPDMIVSLLYTRSWSCYIARI